MDDTYLPLSYEVAWYDTYTNALDAGVDPEEAKLLADAAYDREGYYAECAADQAHERYAEEAWLRHTESGGGYGQCYYENQRDLEYHDALFPNGYNP